MKIFQSAQRKYTPEPPLLCTILFLLKSDVVVELLGAIVAGGEEVEADTTDVLLGAEGFGIIDLVALYFKLHHILHYFEMLL